MPRRIAKNTPSLLPPTSGSHQIYLHLNQVSNLHQILFKTLIKYVSLLTSRYCKASQSQVVKDRSGERQVFTRILYEIFLNRTVLIVCICREDREEFGKSHNWPWMDEASESRIVMWVLNRRIQEDMYGLQMRVSFLTFPSTLLLKPQPPDFQKTVRCSSWARINSWKVVHSPAPDFYFYNRIWPFIAPTHVKVFLKEFKVLYKFYIFFIKNNF